MWRLVTVGAEEAEVWHHWQCRTFSHPQHGCPHDHGLQFVPQLFQPVGLLDLWIKGCDFAPWTRRRQRVDLSGLCPSEMHVYLLKFRSDVYVWAPREDTSVFLFFFRADLMSFSAVWLWCHLESEGSHFLNSSFFFSGVLWRSVFLRMLLTDFITHKYYLPISMSSSVCPLSLPRPIYIRMESTGNCYWSGYWCFYQKLDASSTQYVSPAEMPCSTTSQPNQTDRPSTHGHSWLALGGLAMNFSTLIDSLIVDRLSFERATFTSWSRSIKIEPVKSCPRPLYGNLLSRFLGTELAVDSLWNGK